MRKRLTNYLFSVLALAMIVTSLPVNLLTAKSAEAEGNVSVEETVSGADCDVVEENVLVYMTGEEELTGTVGDNDGFSWSYDESTATLTVTGEICTVCFGDVVV